MTICKFSPTCHEDAEPFQSPFNQAASHIADDFNHRFGSCNNSWPLSCNNSWCDAAPSAPLAGRAREPRRLRRACACATPAALATPATPRLQSIAHALPVRHAEPVLPSPVPPESRPPAGASPCLLACAMRCDSATSRLLEPATLRHLRPCGLCTYALSAPQQAAHTAWRAISALPSRGEPSQSFPAPCSAESDFPNSQLPRSAPGLRHNTAAPCAQPSPIVSKRYSLLF